MSHFDEQYDAHLAGELRASLSGLAVPERPSLGEITSRGRVHWRRRLLGTAGTSLAGVAAGTSLVLAGVLGGVPAATTHGSTAAASGSAPPFRASASGSAKSDSAGTIQTAAFTLTANANGTSTLVLNQHQMFNPAAVTAALKAHGIPALVKVNMNCSSTPSPDDSGAYAPNNGAFILERADGTSMMKPDPNKHPAHGPVKLVINPAAFPAGTELMLSFQSPVWPKNGSYSLGTGLINKSVHYCY